MFRIPMVAFHGPHQDPHDPNSKGEGNSAIDRKFRDAFSALAHAVYSQPDVRNAALEFTGVAIDALVERRVPPEWVFECMRLRFPDTKENVFVKTGVYPYVASVVCDAVRDQVARGEPVSTQALQGLRNIVTSPHLAGSELSLVAYKTFVRGLNNFYQVTKNTSEDDYLLTPSAMMAKLCLVINRRAVTEPGAIAEVVGWLGTLPVSPCLLGDLDSLLWNLAHPNRTNTPTEVRVSAIHAIAERVMKPPVSFHCEERVGVIDAHSASRLFLELAHRCPEGVVLRAVFNRLPEILEREAAVMMSSWSALERSSFVEEGPAVNFAGELQKVFDRLSGDDTILGWDGALLDAIEESMSQASRVENAVLAHRLDSHAARLFPRSWREGIRSSLLAIVRGWDRFFNAPNNPCHYNSVPSLE